jgi:hypothetical protein
MNLSDWFSLGAHHGHSRIQVILYSILLLTIVLSTGSLFMYRMFRDVKLLKDPANINQSEMFFIDLKDKIFGWAVAFIVLSFTALIAITALFQV